MVDAAARMFEPLSEPEKLEVEGGDSRADEWRPSVPAPPDAPPLPKTHPRLGEVSAMWSYSSADGELEGYVCRFDRDVGKEFRPLRHGVLGERTGWHWKGWGDRRPLYRLPELLAKRAAPVIVCEGEKAADAAARLFPEAVGVSPMNGAQSPAKTDWETVRDRQVIVSPDHDEPGRQFGQAVAALCRQAGASSVRQLDPVEVWRTLGQVGEPEEGFDLADVPAEDAHRLAAALDLEALPTWPEPLDAAVGRLAALSPLQYDQKRKSEAKRLGVRVGTLDQQVSAIRPAPGGHVEATGQGQRLVLAEPEPCSEPVDGAELLSELLAQLGRFVRLSEAAATAVALWVLHAHAFGAAFHSPRLAITSPTKRCGKSTLLRCVGRLVPRPLPTSNITPAALFRAIEAWKPSLLIDEADTFMRENEELRGIVNSGHCCSDAFVVRTVGDHHEPRRFSTWAPMAIAAIGRIPDTVADRSVAVAMERKALGEAVEGMRDDRDQGFDPLARKCARWAADNVEHLNGADPAMPPGLHDRACDNWRLMLAIADRVGGVWARLAREAARELSGVDEDETIGVQLLADVRAVFGTGGEIWTEDLLTRLHAMAERPWCEYRRGKPLTPRQLADLLRPFGIKSSQLRIGDANKHGYRREAFAEAWSRYLPCHDGGSSNATTLQLRHAGASGQSPSATAAADVADWNWREPAEHLDCSVVADGMGGMPDGQAYEVEL